MKKEEPGWLFVLSFVIYFITMSLLVWLGAWLVSSDSAELKENLARLFRFADGVAASFGILAWYPIHLAIASVWRRLQ